MTLELSVLCGVTCCTPAMVSPRDPASLPPPPMRTTLLTLRIQGQENHKFPCFCSRLGLGSFWCLGSPCGCGFADSADRNPSWVGNSDRN